MTPKLNGKTVDLEDSACRFCAWDINIGTLSSFSEESKHRLMYALNQI